MPEWGWLVNLTGAVLAGGLAGAALNTWVAARRGQETSKRVLAAVLGDARRAREIVRHNVDTAEPIASDRPRAFISFPTQNYELILFSGQVAHFTKAAILDALMHYLVQAQHVNAIVALYGALDTGPARGATDLKLAYVGAIKKHCELDILPLLAMLEKALEGSK